MTTRNLSGEAGQGALTHETLFQDAPGWDPTIVALEGSGFDLPMDGYLISAGVADDVTGQLRIIHYTTLRNGTGIEFPSGCQVDEGARRSAYTEVPIVLSLSAAVSRPNPHAVEVYMQDHYGLTQETNRTQGELASEKNRVILVEEHPFVDREATVGVLTLHAGVENNVVRAHRIVETLAEVRELLAAIGFGIGLEPADQDTYIETVMGKLQLTENQRKQRSSARLGGVVASNVIQI